MCLNDLLNIVWSSLEIKVKPRLCALSIVRDVICWERKLDTILIQEILFIATFVSRGRPFITIYQQRRNRPWTCTDIGGYHKVCNYKHTESVKVWNEYITWQFMITSIKTQLDHYFYCASNITYLSLSYAFRGFDSISVASVMPV